MIQMKQTSFRLLTVLAALILLTPPFRLSAQNQTVSGVVTDADTGEPLVAAGVVVQGTSEGTVTDIDGNYTIKVPANATLEFSSLGYKTQTVPVNGRSAVNISLSPDSTLLEGVVMLGYSTARKTELSSSVVTVEGDKLRDVTTPDLGNMLQGKVAGVVVFNSSGQPGEDATIRIRGTGSINASSDPLYVVDGIPGGTFNPNDVESITVLKDAGATAIYGASGAGGVIVVTTKKAARGQKNTVEFKVQGGVKRALYGRFHPMNSEELYDLESKLYSRVILPSIFPASVKDTDFDWMGEAFGTGFTRDYYASVSGNSDKINYFASLDHFAEKGTLINTNYRRTSGRINLGFELTKNLTANLRVNYSDNANQNTSSYITLESAYLMMPYDNPYDQVNGGYLYVNGTVRSDTGGRWYSQNAYNIFHNELYNSSKTKGTDMATDLQLNWNISDHFTFTTTNHYGSTASHYRLVLDPRTAITSTGQITETDTFYKSLTTSNLLKYVQTFGGVHSVSGLVGFEYGTSRTDYTTAVGKGMKNGLQSLNASTADSVGGYWTEINTWSLFAQAQYSYAEKYTATASLRADASSVFAPEDRVGYFPSVAGSWVISNEPWMEDQDIFSFLKLRASYGQTGNSGIGAYQYLDLYSFSSATTYQGEVGAYPSRQANPELHWEVAKMTNIGVDANVRDWLEVNLDVYNIDNDDLLLNVPTAPSTGFESIKANRGKVRNRGLDLAINTTNIRTRDFTWTTGFNIGLNRNTVVSLPDGEDIIQTIGSNTARQIIREGESLYSWYMPKWAGVDPETGDPLWYNLDGTTTNVLDPDTQSQIVGCASPKFTGGLVNTLTWKQWTLSANINFVYGNKIFNQTRMYMDADGAYTYFNQMSLDNGLGWSRWEQAGDDATHPKPSIGGNHNANGLSSRYLEDGSFVRLKNLSLSYALPESLLKKLKLSEARLILSADNLLTYSRFSGMDPEVRLESTSSELAGMYSNNYPVGRLITLGVNLKF